VKGIVFGLAALTLAACSTTPHLVNEDTAAAQFARLSKGQKAIAATFYDLGAGDTIKRLYWAQRTAQETGASAEATPPVPLQRRYVNIPVPEHIEPDGTIKEPSTQAVEVVQWTSVVTKDGKRIKICY
jgi:hypothetical protein